MEKPQRPLYIVWQESFLQHEAIIDEQHRGAVAIINSLHYFIQQGFPLQQLKPTVNMLKSYLNFHFITEQGILEAMESPLLKQYKAQAVQTLKEFDACYLQALDEDDPTVLLICLRKWWQQHLELHEKITPFLHEWKGDYCRVNL